MQEFRYKIVPHVGDWREAKTVQKAYELNTPVTQITETYHKGSLTQSLRGIKISNQNIIATVFKRAEDDNGYILRCYETLGCDCETDIEIPFTQKSWTANFGKCEIKTFFIPDNGEVIEKNLLEM